MYPYLEIVGRCVIVYLFMIMAIRISGKTELAQLSVIDLVLILLISNSVQNAMVGSDTSLLGGLTAAAALFVINTLLKFGLFRSKKLRGLLQGEPLLLIYQGKINEKNLSIAQIPTSELEAACREHGVEKIEDVNLALLESDGNISILSGNYQHHSQHSRSIKRRKTQASQG
ncbi:MAG: DUF421 domain-containing protein [Ignavibacteria bacterium]|nr:DUF421 domain-containing protein [Ignavibacteria bacterium]